MSSVEFVQCALHERISPVGSGRSVKDRIRAASRLLGWSFNRTKDAWYADPRISISADEIKEIEEIAGVRYGQSELSKNERIIARAEALLAGEEEDISRSFIAAFRAFLGAMDRAGTSRD
ncbi:hypothetical protein [Phyllobacterium pellucidum]|nr:hypothetical protein [Phyllobacterium pellucidum]